MRILQVRFKNLNSLVGEWAIDLAHPAFAADGIFAITGPTGAGKTTILDALCLALYGRTPRLTRVTKSSNEVMSRQTGECYAEVTFETQAGRYRCHWSQHRARKKPGGELQPPRHEIADADSGRIFDAKLRGVAEQIETATGMDFYRFTRSMLLAQGGFAAFLQAAPDERAPILEQITGTEIYSRISMRVHEQRSEARRKFDILTAEMAGMQLLSEADEMELNAGLARRCVQETASNQVIAQHKQAIAWIDGIDALRAELQCLDARQQVFQARRQAFQPELERLQRATRSLELSGEHAALSALRRAHETDAHDKRQCLLLLPIREAGVNQAYAASNLAAEMLENRKTEQREALLVIRSVRALDLQLREKEAPLKAARETIAAQEKSLAMLGENCREDKRILGNQKQAHEEILRLLTHTCADETLVEHLAGIRGRFEALEHLMEQRGAKAEEVKAAEREVAEATQVRTQYTAGLETCKRQQESLRNTLDQKQRELKTLLGDQALTEWRDRWSASKERKSLLEKATEAVLALAETQLTLNGLGSRHAVLSGSKTDLGAQLEIHRKQHAGLERELHLLETQAALIKQIQDFEQARHQLQDGQPCPLCGAREHPFARGNLPVADETAAALARARGDLKAATHTGTALVVKQAQILTELEQNGLRQEECTARIAAAQALIHHCRQALAIEAAEAEVEARLPNLYEENEEALTRAARIVQVAEALEKELGALRETLQAANESVAQVERETQKAAHQVTTATLTRERVAKDAEVLDNALQRARAHLLRELSAYGIDRLPAEGLAPVLDTLTARRKQWLARQKEKAALERDIDAKEIQTRHQEAQMQALNLDTRKARELFGGLVRDRERLTQERYALFGDQHPDDAESRLGAIVEAAEKARDEARRTLGEAEKECAALKTRIAALEESMAARAGHLTTTEAAFALRLAACGFADEACYLAACLPEEERTALMLAARQLEDEHTELASQARDKNARLETERRKGVTERSREALEQALNTLETEHRDLQQEIGALRQKLKENQELKQRYEERAGLLDVQKRECARWDLLHELIGSADGKKYRNFAQSLTFDMMIGHANRQLQKMTDRYLLIRDDAQPLELNVIDNYQAGEIRSTKNLSGGESFIVSLSLALGLSHMASKNVRVDSLFLDEGFGTLDEEALDTALETLAGLRREGKLIGVISHVPALKERIGTQIEVIPRTGGRSVISGPGCSPVSAAANCA
jgi:DNA repair protein SbcC/Rad50